MKILADRTLRSEGGEVLANGAMVPPAQEPAPRAPDPLGARVCSLGGPPALTGGPLPRELFYVVTATNGGGVVRVRRRTVATAFAAVARLRELGYRVSVMRRAS